ncbi:MAG: hypothetical protein F4243_12290 [Chloroflexi bacterium]|nr:hypothetical protein [Chloroflexota bacterium]
MMKASKRADSFPPWLTALINTVLVVVALALAVVTFFASLELALVVGARVIISTNDSLVRGNYALATLRNLWLMGGGLLTVAFVIATLDYFFKRWRQPRTRRAFLRVLAVELAAIGVAVALLSIAN